MELFRRSFDRHSAWELLNLSCEFKLQITGGIVVESFDMTNILLRKRETKEAKKGLLARYIIAKSTWDSVLERDSKLVGCTHANIASLKDCRVIAEYSRYLLLGFLWEGRLGVLLMLRSPQKSGK